MSVRTAPTCARPTWAAPRLGHAGTSRTFVGRKRRQPRIRQAALVRPPPTARRSGRWRRGEYPRRPRPKPVGSDRQVLDPLGARTSLKGPGPRPHGGAKRGGLAPPLSIGDGSASCLGKHRPGHDGATLRRAASSDSPGLRQRPPGDPSPQWSMSQSVPERYRCPRRHPGHDRGEEFRREMRFLSPAVTPSVATNWGQTRSFNSGIQAYSTNKRRTQGVDPQGEPGRRNSAKRPGTDRDANSCVTSRTRRWGSRPAPTEKQDETDEKERRK